jgi:hypothetical protein
MDTADILERDLDKTNLSQLLHSLDEKSRSILWYLWWYRHADISELRTVCNNTDDYEVLHRLKDVINQKSIEQRGQPIVSFEQSKIDPSTGEKILFSWWYLDEEKAPLQDLGNALVDLFHEKDNITIIAQLPASVSLSAPDIQFKNGILRVKFMKSDSTV